MRYQDVKLLVKLAARKTDDEQAVRLMILCRRMYEELSEKGRESLLNETMLMKVWDRAFRAGQMYQAVTELVFEEKGGEVVNE